ncbi:MAG: hypothetical protein WCB68_11695 [Pyrinomonadaceae bacterium]
MMRKTLAALLMLLTTTLAYAFQEHGKENGTWSMFSSPAGRFQILVPAKPEESTESANSSVGPYTVHLFTSKSENAIYIFGWTDYDPTFNFGVRAELNANRDNFLKGVSGKLLSESNITLDGNPGIEFTAEGPNAFFKSRVYIIGKRPFQLIVAVPTGRNDDEGMKRFLASFKLTPAR